MRFGADIAGIAAVEVPMHELIDVLEPKEVCICVFAKKS